MLTPDQRRAGERDRILRGSVMTRAEHAAVTSDQEPSDA